MKLLDFKDISPGDTIIAEYKPSKQLYNLNVIGVANENRARDIKDIVIGFNDSAPSDAEFPSDICLAKLPNDYSSATSYAYWVWLPKEKKLFTHYHIIQLSDQSLFNIYSFERDIISLAQFCAGCNYPMMHSIKTSHCDSCRVINEIS